MDITIEEYGYFDFYFAMHSIFDELALTESAGLKTCEK